MCIARVVMTILLSLSSNKWEFFFSSQSSIFLIFTEWFSKIFPFSGVNSRILWNPLSISIWSPTWIDPKYFSTLLFLGINIQIVWNPTPVSSRANLDVFPETKYHISMESTHILKSNLYLPYDPASSSPEFLPPPVTLESTASVPRGYILLLWNPTPTCMPSSVNHYMYVLLEFLPYPLLSFNILFLLLLESFPIFFGV